MQCVFCNCAKKGLGWCRKKRKMPTMEEKQKKKKRPLLGGLSWLPISTGLLTILTCAVTYTIAVLSNHIMVVLPYVSDAGMHYPESSIFSLCLDIVVALLTTTLVVRYYLLAGCPPELEPKSRLRYERVNKSSLVIGCFSAFGLAMLSNFPEDENLTVHLIGAFFCFLFGVMYCFMHSWLSFQAWSTITNPYICILRLALASFSAADLAMVILFGSGLRWYATKDNPVLHYRRISAAFEWMLVVKLNVYFMTFSHEFRHIKLVAQLHHWRGNQWEPIEGSIGSATPATASLNEDDVEAIQVKGSIMIKIPEDWDRGYYYSPGSRDSWSSMTTKEPPYIIDKIDDLALKNALYSSIISSSFSNIVGDLFEPGVPASPFDEECKISFSHPVCFSDFDDNGMVGNRPQSVLGSTQFHNEKNANQFSQWAT